MQVEDSFYAMEAFKNQKNLHTKQIPKAQFKKKNARIRKLLKNQEQEIDTVDTDVKEIHQKQNFSDYLSAQLSRMQMANFSAKNPFNMNKESTHPSAQFKVQRSVDIKLPLFKKQQEDKESKNECESESVYSNSPSCMIDDSIKVMTIKTIRSKSRKNTEFQVRPRTPVPSEGLDYFREKYKDEGYEESVSHVSVDNIVSVSWEDV